MGNIEIALPGTTDPPAGIPLIDSSIMESRSVLKSVSQPARSLTTTKSRVVTGKTSSVQFSNSIVVKGKSELGKVASSLFLRNLN
jgi:hypothetical protein